MGRRNKTHLCGPLESSVYVSKIGALTGICSLLLLYYGFRRNGFLRHHHHPEQLTEMEIIAQHRTAKENKFLDLTRTTSEIRVINIVPIGFSNSKSSGFFDMSKRSVDQAVGEYEAMPNATKEHSTFLFHSFDMMRDGDTSISYTADIFDACNYLASSTNINTLHIYNEIQATQHLDLISASIKVRQFIEAVVHVRLSLEETDERDALRKKRMPYKTESLKFRNRMQGSKLQLNLFVSDVHVSLYHAVLQWVLGLTPSLDDFVVLSVEVSNE